jgi:hypothetical protein
VSGDEAHAAFGAPSRKARASALGYWIGGAFLAAALLGAIAWFVIGMVRFSDAVDDLQRVAVPGERVMTLSAGRKAIYYEGPGGEDAVIPPLRVRVAAQDGGPALAIGEHAGSVSYSMGGHAGRSLAGVRVPRSGRYRVAVEGSGSGAQLAIGRGLGNRLVTTIVGAVVIFFVAGGVGAALLARTSARR